MLKFNIDSEIFSAPFTSYIQDLKFGKGLCARPAESLFVWEPFLSDNHCMAFDFKKRQIGFTKVKNKPKH
ncbi:hypothetical protein M3Y98_00807700 [Aphelenchoides besseyi]|nr:hypothetical protein M3Y98_00807700 [Aphelenchoides besseyi]KAI6212099.1 hypothetical protein M3Y96_00504600 [Aphelenchoides besseyi]